MSTPTTSLVWKTPAVSSPAKPSVERLNALERRLFNITIQNDPGTKRSYTVSREPGFMDQLHFFYHSTDEKQVGAQIVRSHIVPKLENPKTYLSIGAGEGVFSSNTLEAEQFKEAILVDRNPEALKILEKYFSLKFKNKKPKFLHNFAQAIKIANGYAPCKPHLKFQLAHAEFPYGVTASESEVKSVLTSNYELGWLNRKRTPLPDSISIIGDDNAPYTLRISDNGLAAYKSYDFPQADLVCLDHMLYFHPPEHWVDIATQAYQLVKPGGAMVILVHGDALFNEPNEVANIINALGGQNDDINGFAQKLQTALPDARFDYLAVKTRHWAASEKSMYELLKFFAYDTGAVLGANAMSFIMANSLRVSDYEVKDGKTAAAYECVKADKFIVAYKAAPESPYNGIIPLYPSYGDALYPFYYARKE